MTHLTQTPPGARFRKPWELAANKARARIAANSGDAEAHCALAENLITLWCYGYLRREEALPGARASVAAALECSPGMQYATMLRGILEFGDWKWAEAEKSLRHARSLDESYAPAQHWLALFLAAMRRFDEAIPMSERSMELDEAFRLGFGSVLYFAHDFERMAVVMERMIADSPDYAPGYDWLGMAYVQLGRFDDSIRVYRRAVELGDYTVEIEAGLAHAYGLAGREKEAREILDKYLELAKTCYIPSVQVAYVAFGLNETDLGLRLLEQGYAEKSWFLAFAGAEPWLDHLRSDSRFADLIRRMNLPEPR